MTTRFLGRSLFPLLALSALVWLAVPLTPPLVAREAPAQVPPSWRFSLPAGDPAAGEAVFVKMKCGACHNVEGRDARAGGEHPEAVGPELTRAQAQLPAEYLAEHLINADRFLPHGLFHATYSRSDGSSRMGNFNEEMSVKELIDLVSFLRSIGTPSE